MALTGTRTFVGFGFGAIQAGLFLYEAFASGNFKRLVVAEVVPDIVDAVRRAGGHFSVNIASEDGVEACEVGPIEILDPAVAADREALLEAIAGADEIGTAVPSVTYYSTGGPASIDKLLAEGLRRRSAEADALSIVYAAENNNEAAEILSSHVLGNLPADDKDRVTQRVQFLNTVVGKMSGVIEVDDGDAANLHPVTPGGARAFLVEEFNQILISRVGFAMHFARGISVFEEKDDLLPFEEAKLYGHNATHALAAYVAAVLGLEKIADLRDVRGAVAFLRAAFIEESGAALVRKYDGLDSLFTWDGYRQYAGGLLERMTNPYLRDSVERVGRDPARKLGWDDRLIGTIRLALSQGIQPRRYALGAAAAVVELDRTLADQGAAASVLGSIWNGSVGSSGDRNEVLSLVDTGLNRLRAWRARGCGDLELLFHRDDEF